MIPPPVIFAFLVPSFTNHGRISRTHNKNGWCSNGSPLRGGIRGSSLQAIVLEFLDCHHHFYDTINNDFSTFLKRHFPNESFLPHEYYDDVVEPIEDSEVLGGKFRHSGSVHVELMPDDGLLEAMWVADVQTRMAIANDNPYTSVRAMVASCPLADDVDAVRRNLEALREFSPQVRGIRWILDCVGPRLDGGGNVINPATLVGNLRHDGVDYLDDHLAFERGYALLEDYGFSFDLHCAPKQLPSAAKLCSKHPNIPVVINHLGRPMQLYGERNSQMMPDAAKLEEWRTGMRAMAALPQAHVKISGLGWAVPNWTASARRIDTIRQLCRETVALFGPDRCMIGTNWWHDADRSDAGGLEGYGPSAEEYLEYMLDFFGGLTTEEQQMLFAGTAKRFYRIS